MSNFNKAYDMLIEDIIQSVTKTELNNRRKEYPKIKLKLLFDKLFKENKMVKNLDGTYDVNGDLHLFNLDLTSLKNLPYRLNKINGYFTCTMNKLTNLIGCPTVIGEDFNCSYNKLISLKNCNIASVNGYFDCSANNLTNLIGCPKIINRDFRCSLNNLTSLEGCPIEVKGDFHIVDNSDKLFTAEEVRKICKVGGKIYV